MRPTIILCGAAVSLALAACGQSEAPEQESAAAPAAPAAEVTGEIHAATGVVAGVAPDAITIAHEPVDSLGWPSMTMQFQAGHVQDPETFSKGDRIRFEFVEAEDGYALVSAERL